MKSIFLKKLTVLAGTVAMTAAALVAGPASIANAASRPEVPFGMNVWTNGNATNNTTGVFDVPNIPGASMNIGMGSTVNTGTVKAGDVITLTTRLVDDASGTGILATMYAGQANKNELLVERTMGAPGNYYNWNFPTAKEIVRSHTITATDITHGWFANGQFNTSSAKDANQTWYYNDAGWTNYSFARPTEYSKVRLNTVWKLNGTVITATNNYNMNVNVPFSNSAAGTTIDSATATYLGTNNGMQVNSGGCVDTTNLAVGDVLEVDYAFTVDGVRPTYVNNSYNNNTLNWSVNTDPNPPTGTTGSVAVPYKAQVNSYRFLSATTAEITSYNFNAVYGGYKVGDRVTFSGPTLSTVFPAAEYTVSAVNSVNYTIQITGTGWTAGSQVYPAGVNYVGPANTSIYDTYSLTLTQAMIDGYVVSGTKTNLLGLNVYQYGIQPKAGQWVFDAKAHKKGDTKNLTVSCAGDDVVNLKTSKEANGDTVITFQEPTGSKYSASTRHWCQLKTSAGGTVPLGTWIGGVPALEVTPSTTPKTYKCTVGSLETGASYSLALYNQIGMGWNTTPQTTWVTFKNAEDVSTDATLISAGIGTATEGTTFDPAVLTYNVTSTDITTPYPNVVTGNSKATYVVKLGGVTVTKPNNLNLVTGKNVVTIEVTSPSGAKKTYTFNITKVDTASDATLNSLSFGSETVSPAFSSSTTTYSATVSSTTTTYPFPSYATTQDSSTVVVKNAGSVVTGPGALSLVDGLNAITVEVTAPNGTTKKIYTINITKMSAAKDPNLTALPVITGVTTSPSFDADVTSYTGSVSESTTTATVSGGATTAINGATTVYKLNGAVVTMPGSLKLRPGANTLETIVTSSDGTTTKTYTQTISRAVLAAGSSTDANDARLAVNPVPGASYTVDGQTVNGFDSELSYEPNVYTKNVPVNQTEVVLADGGAANSGATIVNEYSTDNGATWIAVVAPNKVPLAAGKTTKIRTTVTKGTSTKIYMTDVVRPAEDPTADVGPVEGDGDAPAKGIAGTGKFIPSNDPSFQLAWNKATGVLKSQATGIYIGYIEAKITFTKAGKTYTCTAQFGTIKAMPAATAAQKLAAMKSKTFAGKQFCIDKTKLDPKTTAPVGGFTTANFKKIKPMNKTAAELTQEKAALAALKGFSGEVAVQVVRYRAWPSTMVNLGNWDSKGGKISVQTRNTKVNLN